MIRYLFVGDLHGDLTCAFNIIDVAQQNACDQIVQVGDWGFLWPNKNQTAELSSYLVERDIKMRFCDGNHDWHPRLRQLRPCDDNVAPNITYQPRGSLFEDSEETRFVFLGGAPSIDYRGRTEHVSWWPEEVITEADVNVALAWKGRRIDVLVTHDCGYQIEGFKESSDMSFFYRAIESRDSIRRVIEELRPTMQVHGHYHHRYVKTIDSTKIQGLGANVTDFAKLFLFYERTI